MFELFQNLSDNQTAILFSVGSLAGTFALLSLSFYANPANRDVVREPVRQRVEIQGAEQRKKAA